MKSLDLKASVFATLVLSLCLGPSPVAQTQRGFIDPLDAAAVSLQTVALAHNPTMAIGLAGNRLVAVGMRGLIIISDDQGATWRQATVPVQSDMTAVYFVTPDTGWAVGHDGVILRSDDAGASWRRQSDGRQAAVGFKAFYSQRITAGEQGLERWLGEIDRNYGHGPTLPYLDVLFEDSLHGYAVGSFGLLAITADGGETWQPGFERVDNPQLLNLNALRKIGNDIYIAGEQGSVFRLNRASQRFESLDTGYAGSFFGINGNNEQLLAYGLRGSAYRSTDAGKSWQPVELAEHAALTSSTVLPDGRLALSSIAGQLWISSPDWHSFQALRAPQPAMLTGLAALADGGLMISSLAGMQRTDFGIKNASPATAAGGMQHE